MCTQTAEQLTKDQINFIMKAGELGLWQLDFQSGVLSCSDSCKANFGVPPEAIFTYRDIESLIVKEDRGRWGQTVADAIRDHTIFECEYRITTPKGELRWIHAKGEIVYDGKGIAQQSSGFTQNVTARKQAELAHLEKREMAEDILASIADGFVAVDADWRISYFNPRGREILAPLVEGHARLLGQCIWDLPEITGTIIEENYRRAVRDQVTVDFELFYAPLNRHLFVRAYPAKSGLSIYFLDISHCKKSNSATRDGGYTDSHEPSI